MKQDGFFLPNPRTRLLTLCFSVLFAVLLLVSATVGKHQNLLPHAGSLFADETGVPHFLFWQLWLPRALVAAGVGAALAVSGCFFQLLSRNPLGSPDIIGINAGASLGAVAVSLVWVNTLPVTLGALIGAVATLVLVLLGNGTRNRFSLEIVIGGLAVNALAMAAVQFVLTGVRQEDAYLISVWLSGSLAQRGWGEVAVVWTTLPVCATALALLGRPFAVMQVSPAAAAFLGVPLKKYRFGVCSPPPYSPPPPSLPPGRLPLSPLPRRTLPAKFSKAAAR
ncbi:hypothetical protein BG910_10440 [Neisseria chenwenguii]|uniref:Iron ABC transporter permease n=1 Tax=Neisseria chenwenguii TaxID=1853278 RepID=A0A220S3K6_9NEIS|nr:iron chelate uptake ABC transporter family permease subunit [Neisseria chenwenguii]ASK28089.1 hypothetical protein BG910_10440 [Neisseria chenwenguii]